MPVYKTKTQKKRALDRLESTALNLCMSQALNLAMLQSIQRAVKREKAKL
jgi:hypothetical protein